jgi:formate-dependent nitrite reductase cytochrome c552 subunit
MTTDTPTAEDIVMSQHGLDNASEFAYQAIRYLCHNRTDLVPVITQVLGNLQAATSALPTALDYLQADLDAAVRRGDLYHAEHGNPIGNVEEAKLYMAEAMYHAREAAAKLSAAQQKLTWVGHQG